MTILVSERNAAAFSTDDIAEGHPGSIPPEVAEYGPLKAPAARFLDLSARFSEAVQKVHALLGEVQGAINADRHALQLAAVEGADDPGTPAQDALADRIIAAKRAAQGLADGLGAAHGDLLDALREHAEDFERQLDTDQEGRRREAVELLAALEANVSAAGGPEAALRWYRQTIDPRRSWGGLASYHVPDREVFVQGQPLQLGHVLHGLREAVG